VCTALLKKVVSPNNCKITKLISLAQDFLGWINLKPPSGLAENFVNAAVWDGLMSHNVKSFETFNLNMVLV